MVSTSSIYRISRGLAVWSGINYLMKRGKLAVIAGPSGVGKDTLVNHFLAENSSWQNPPSVTTRPARSGETADKDMRFVDIKTFRLWQSEGKFLESFEVYKDIWYGTLKEPVEKLRQAGTNVLLRIDVQGALEVKRIVPEAITIFIEPENFEMLQTRILKRGSETAERLAERLAVAEQEIAASHKFDHIVTNEHNQQIKALQEIKAILNND